MENRVGGAGRLCRVVNLFKKRPRRPLTSRRPAHADRAINRVGLAQLTPELHRYLAHAAYLQLSIFESISRAIIDSNSTRTKTAVSHVANTVIDRHHALTGELEREGRDPAEAMEPFADAVAAFHQRIQGASAHELLMSAYVVSGILDDCFVQLAGGLPGDYPQRMAELLGGDEVTAALAEVIRSEIDANPRLSSRLALWGRRLVGDTLIVARSAADIPQDAATDDERLEPAFTDLVADHTRRMDDLGLTA